MTINLELNLENERIQIIEAVTETNGKQNKSRIQGEYMRIGCVIGRHSQGEFFEDTIISNEVFGVFYRFETGELELTKKPFKPRNKSVTIKRFGVLGITEGLI